MPSRNPINPARIAAGAAERQHGAMLDRAVARDHELPGEQATVVLAAHYAARARAGDVILLSGPLGAGKSVFARAFLRALAEDPALEVPSPTFTLVQVYGTKRGPAWHFDLWRLSHPMELAELGWEEARRGIVLVEWADRLGSFVPPEALAITLAITGPATRRATVLGWAERGA